MGYALAQPGLGRSSRGAATPVPTAGRRSYNSTFPPKPPAHPHSRPPMLSELRELWRFREAIWEFGQLLFGLPSRFAGLRLPEEHR